MVKKVFPAEVDGKIFGRWTVLERDSKKECNWLCECACGTKKSIFGADIVRGHSKSCGCLQRRDLSGQKFGKLTAIKSLGDSGHGVLWACVCECGKSTAVTTNHLTSGNTRSCGCLNADALLKRNTTHGHAKRGETSIEYRIWVNMISRCTVAGRKDSKYYFDRNLPIQVEWVRCFPTFIDDMGPIPQGMEKPSIDRIDNNLGYIRGNCRWLSMADQMRNRRDNRYLTYSGKTRLILEWAELVGVRTRMILSRIDSCGWSSEDALRIKPLPRSLISQLNHGLVTRAWLRQNYTWSDEKLQVVR